MNWIDALIVLGFVAYSVTAGFYYRRKASRNLEEYFLAGRTLPGWMAGLSMSATQYSADTPLLVAGLVATAGIFSLWRLWVYGIAFLLMAFVLATSWRRSGVLTDAELTELRYGGRAAFALRVLKAVHFGTIVNCTVLAMVLTAAARVAEPFLTWHLWLPRGWIDPLARLLERMGFLLTALPADHPAAWTLSAGNFISIGCIVAFTWLYSTTGGLRSVVMTDVAQFLIMILATAVYAGFVLYQIGGLSALPARLQSLYGAETARSLLSFGPIRWDDAAVLFAAVLAVQWFAQVNADGTGYLAQRSMACRSDGDARAAGVTFTFVQVLGRSLIWLPIILGLLIVYPADPLQMNGSAGEAFRVQREALFAYGIRDLLPWGVRGFMLTAMIAALASTVDTHLNWGASYWANDLYKRFLMEAGFHRAPSSRELVWIARLSNVVILLIALGIAIHLSSIQSAWHLTLLVGSGLGVVLILRWLWWRINVYSEITACAAALILSPILLFGFPGLNEGARLLWMTALSTLAVLAVTLFTPPENEETLQRFYARVHPYGFWGPVARRCAEDPALPLRGLKRELLCVVLASLSLFMLLVGGGIFLARSPHGLGVLKPLFLIAAGLGLIPVWARLGFRPPLPLKR